MGNVTWLYQNYVNQLAAVILIFIKRGVNKSWKIVYINSLQRFCVYRTILNKNLKYCLKSLFFILFYTGKLTKTLAGSKN